MKTDESMSTQELLMEDKFKESRGKLEAKRAKLAMMKQKRA